MGNHPFRTAVLVGIAASCASSAGDRNRSELPLGGGSPIEILRSPELDEIAQLEYERSTGDGRLMELAASGGSATRLRATVALGRLPYPDHGQEVTDAIVRGLEDPDADVRYAAAFALGQRADLDNVGVISAYRNDPDPKLRARIVEAAIRFEDQELQREILLSLSDTDLEVRISAVLATALWDPEAPNAAAVDRELVAALIPAAATPVRTGVEVPHELAWRILYALQRRGSERGRRVFLEYADSSATLERIFAVRGLARLDPDPDSTRALMKAATDPDWRVACEAVIGLGRHGDPDAIPVLATAIEHNSHHVRRRGVEALGGFADKQSAVMPLISRGARDLSASVRAAAALALAGVLPSQKAAKELEDFVEADDPIVRAGAAEAVALLETEHALEPLTRLARDSDPRVAWSAVFGLGSHPAPESRELLHELLAGDDYGIRLAAVVALREMPDKSDVGPLARCVPDWREDIGPEIAFNVVYALGAIGGNNARGSVQAMLAHPHSHVRRVARNVLRDDFGLTDVPTAQPASFSTPRVPLPGRDYERWKRNPLVEIRTTRGSMVFELFPLEAPVHVHNFIELAKKDHYDGLIFHRVVPDFVIQGGDYRGDGNGSKPWNGEPLGQEFTQRRFERGSLGMPRNEDFDSGGSQIFVTHRPTPHLNGRYTIFGELRTGGDVLDRIEVGDRILDVRVGR